jgi:DNA repair protein RadC
MYENETVNRTELIRDLPPVVRPLSRLASLGTEALKEQELLALVLRSRTLKTAEELLAKRSLKEMLGLPFARLSGLKGIGRTGAAAMLAAAEMTRRSDNRHSESIPTLRCVSDVTAQAIEIRDKKREHLLAFFLNARQQMIGKEVISIGTLTASLCHPRELFAPAIGKSAAGLILCHNHPSGDPSPSDEDIRLTKRITQAGNIMGIELLDHLIVAQNGCYSFKQSGAL